MTTRSPQRADGWAAAVRQRLGLGRLLPLGGPGDGVWIAETAAASVLRGAAAVPGTVLGKLRIGSAAESAVDPAETGTSAVDRGARASAPAPASVSAAAPAPAPAPVSALPAGPLRIEAEFSAGADRPLPDAAAAVREALWAAADARLGLDIAEVDLRVTELLDGDAPDQVTPAVPTVPVATADGPAAVAAAGVPGVVSLTAVLGPAVRTAQDHVRIEVATAADRRALDVARSVRRAVAAATEDRLPVTVLVTNVVEPGPGT
ncbi:hypothetical protein [Streptomyces sp. NPDC101181]|uniref:hypothetical protein n=1 Tax=Streptomyces sp. NPDC101181 TaxID=3366125 RepID=UPI003805AB54